MSDFPSDLLERKGHRPWPVPTGPWIMTQSWHDLLFVHWPVEASLLRRHVPQPLELDLFDGHAWLAVVPFTMTNVAPRGVPAFPMISSFHELNVRTYVTRQGKPGVYFFSLDANSRMAVAAARAMFGLPYFVAEMELEGGADGISYRSVRKSPGDPEAELRARYRPIGPPRAPERGSIEYFLTERYCLYTVDSRSRVHRLEIHHPPWPLQPAEAEIETNTMIEAGGIELAALDGGRTDACPVLHFSKRQDVLAWPLEPA
jgi:uncharacterized protein